jgi:hypothetical protein
MRETTARQFVNPCVLFTDIWHDHCIAKLFELICTSQCPVITYYAKENVSELLNISLGSRFILLQRWIRQTDRQVYRVQKFFNSYNEK